MANIVDIKQAAEISKKLQKQGKVIVVAGGCFDILHTGHIHFLEGAKEQGDLLFVLLESDENIKRYKGINRPINSQNDRSHILSSLSAVDYVVLLPVLEDDAAYDEMILAIQPAIIATTIGDPKRSHKERQAELIRGNVVDVVQHVANASTSRLAALLKKEL